MIRILIFFLMIGSVVNGHDYVDVVVQLYDADTGDGVSGVKVETDYWMDPEVDLKLPRSEGVTDMDGKVALRVYRAVFSDVPLGVVPETSVSVVWQISVDNESYRDDHSSYTFDRVVESALTKRPIGQVPDAPDYAFGIKSLASKAQHERKQKELEEQNKRQAREWLMHAPEYWPPEDDYSWGKPALLLIGMRWEKASLDRLGSKTDILRISESLLAAFRMPNQHVGETRWLSSSEVMVKYSWYQANLSAGSYTVILRKEGERWIVHRKYLESMA